MTRAKSIAVVAFVIAAGLGVFVWKRNAAAPTAPVAKAPPVEPRENKPKATEHPKTERGAAGPPMELQVALIVARGATNKEAGAALFLSPKTIEAHLGRIYRKLGVRSRTELSHRLAGEGPVVP